jgi:type II secretory ATPase GspE/PulE/Tfp pilus assembly ATPase PilB-like protein
MTSYPPPSTHPAPAVVAPDAWLLPIVRPLLADAGALVPRAGERCWDAARRAGLSDRAIVAAVAARFRLPVADLAAAPSVDARALVPEAVARRHQVVPLGVSRSGVDVASADPHDLDAERAVAFASGRRVRLSVASPSAIEQALDALYHPTAAIDRILAGVARMADVRPIAVDGGAAQVTSADGDDRPVIRLVDHIVAGAVAARASDVHLESAEGAVVVRHRVDGMLRVVLTLPRGVGIPLVSRVKIMSGLDIADRLRPQDGRARVLVDGTRVDLRVSTLPAAHGEKVVIRILDTRAAVPTLGSLGFDDVDSARIGRLLDAREGIILVTGPTGSGKSTTLYAALREVQTRGVNVVTVEDPVEYRMPGVVQVQVNEKAGLTFAAALRSILRQDPDVVLVGEIRDRETAAVAVQAALTGHLVLSTLHTIDAPSAITRLMDIGVERYKIAAALKGVIAQRLVRRVCAACGGDATAVDSCAGCGGEGFTGRIAVAEVLVNDDAVERAVAAGEAVAGVASLARASGMRSLWASGLAQIHRGRTTMAELLRVIEPPAPDSNASPATRAPPHLARGTAAVRELPDFSDAFDLLPP